MKLRHADISEIVASPSKLLSEVEEGGEPMIITRNGTPILEVRPHHHAEHRVKKDWKGFFELAKKTEVPDDFLSRCEREPGVMNDKILDDAIRQAIENMPLEKRKKLLSEAIEKAGPFINQKR
ncbi:hypothetical protein KG088_17345 [Halomonas sp. TRM85114]|uniref:type II toxin-antitoxin system Phd/YefM family antitoxin n=1 Tax=Halomonas jincaotanensis TaxID=2810616 RepID=UPI001BD49304|nr:hypothetical protein [Halomonas jincaotanensis]MBS9405379.1 hypothetical protein [Halomonas jincaotanensis]